MEFVYCKDDLRYTKRIIMSKKKAISMIQTLKRDCIHTYISHDISKEVCRDLRFRLDEIIKELDG